MAEERHVVTIRFADVAELGKGLSDLEPLAARLQVGRYERRQVG